MKIEYVSASRIKTWKYCQFMYMLEYHLNLDTGTSFAAEQGSMIHVIFERLGQDLKDKVPLKESFIYNNWQEEVLYAYREEKIWELSKAAIERPKNCEGCKFFQSGTCQIAGRSIDTFEGCPKVEYEEAIELIKKVIDYPRLNFPLDEIPLGIEEEFNLEIENDDDPIRVKGIIDVLRGDQTTIEVVDYKSGNYIQSYNQCAKDPQLLIYHLAIRETKNCQNILVTIFYLRKYQITLAFSKKDEEGTKIAIKKHYNDIKQCVSPQRRCDRSDGSIKYDYVCEKMCDIELCNEQFEIFKENGYKIGPPSDKPKQKKQWLKHLTEGTNKDKAYKNISGEKK